MRCSIESPVAGSGVDSSGKDRTATPFIAKILRAKVLPPCIFLKFPGLLAAGRARGAKHKPNATSVGRPSVAPQLAAGEFFPVGGGRQRGCRRNAQEAPQRAFV